MIRVMIITGNYEFISTHVSRKVFEKGSETIELKFDDGAELFL